MTASPHSEYGIPVKFFAESALYLKFKDFNLLFLKRIRTHSSESPSDDGPGSIVYVFELTDLFGKKSELSVIAASGIRPDHHPFSANEKLFQLFVTEFNSQYLKNDELVISLLS